MVKHLRKTLLSTLILLALTPYGSSACAGIVFDYSHDTFFASNATAKAALEAAAGDINAVIKTVLTEITTAQDTITGTNASATATFDHSVSYTNPTTGGSETFDPVALAAGEVKIFTGMRNLLGTTLGLGGPGAVEFSASGSFTSAADFPGAVTDAETQANTIYGRGGGPIISNLSGSFGLGDSYDINYGSTIGNLWFDSDTDNDGDFDTTSELAASWHFDHTTSVAAEKDDFYSVALHEILHAIGFGTADSWDDLVSGTNWTGSQVIALVGSGTGLVDSGGGHVAEEIMSTRISDGVAQEVVMDPTLTVGTRKELPVLDVAFLRDIGWSTVPEPNSWALMSIAIAVTTVYRARQRQRRRKADSCSQNAA